MDSEVRYRLERAGRGIDIDVDGALSSTATDSRWDIELRVTLDGEPFFEWSWSEAIPRRLV